MTVVAEHYVAEKVAAKDLRLADEVRLDGMSAWNTAIVEKVTDEFVTFFRPYGVSADFSYTGGVLCYTGVEHFSVWRNDQKYDVVRRKELK